jgi:hypothetical protein
VCGVPTQSSSRNLNVSSLIGLDCFDSALGCFLSLVSMKTPDRELSSFEVSHKVVWSPEIFMFDLVLQWVNQSARTDEMGEMTPSVAASTPRL